MHFELVKEVLEQKVLEDATFNMVRKLTQNGVVLICGDGVILVVLPEVLEIRFHLGDHFGRQRLVVVEILEYE